MARLAHSSNPLALAVLALLFERPMHPYEMAATLRERHKEESIKLRYGSLYTVIELLVREGFILPKETLREGRRPERTVYTLTPVGEVEMRDWLADLIANPVKEYPRFEAALSLMPALGVERVTDLLEARLVRLDQEMARVRAGMGAAPSQVPRLFLIEGEYYLACLEAERRFVADLVDGIKNETLDGVKFWKQVHAAKRAGDPLPSLEPPAGGSLG